MAALVLCRRGPRLRYVQGLVKDFTQAQHLYGKPKHETNEQEGTKGTIRHRKASLHERYRLHYNPSSYHHSVQNSAATCGKTDNDEDGLVAFTPSFWQQGDRNSVSCSRHLSSSENTLLDKALNKSSEAEMPSVSPHSRVHVQPNVKVDPRAFIRCRPEYALMTLDLAQRPDAVPWDEACSLLQKVTGLKGCMTPSHVCQFLAELGRVHPDKTRVVWSDQRFIMLLRYSVEHLPNFSELQLLEALRSFVWLDMPSAHTVLTLYEAELSHRARNMSLHQLLLAADMWRSIGRQSPQFLGHLYDLVHQNLGQIGVSELVQLLYLMGENRECPKGLIQSVEQLIRCHLNQLHHEEVGTVCLGLFKSKTSISADTVTHLVDKAQSVVKEMSDFALVNVMKYLRFSYLYHKDWMEAVVQEVPARASRMGVQGLMHVVLACSALHYRNDNILTAVADRVPSLLPHCRSKDSCKLLWAFGTMGFDPSVSGQSSSFYPSLIESVRQKQAEFQRYPEHLLTGLLGLAFVSQFPEDLIALALSPEFVNLCLKFTQLDLRKDMFTLDGVVALELPQWTGPRLSQELREEVAHMLWSFAQSDMCQKPEVQEAEAALQHMLGGEEFVFKRMILPHTRSIDLEVHLDSTGRPVPVNKASLSAKNSSSKVTSNTGRGRINKGVTITEDLLAQLVNTKNTTQTLSHQAVKPASVHRLEPDEGRMQFATGLDLTSDIIENLIKPSSRSSAPPDSNGIVKLAIQVSNRNHYCYHSQQLLGLHAMKRRQLNLAGYRVVELEHHEWFPLLRKSRSEKLAYLHCKVYDSLK
ncbi:FAST kinase domain-containing protein 5, mitochondrial [Betta splendens]|uniref:FAST kinase domain-containing protein 5, mitochondrial n=1 Tax=Betta splendens TaxID=158456 RepID=A0A6P7LD09_BETSP|nr:FAST kinase domain-containing protein 5, mitochondrial [Betta splendens]